MIDSDIMSDDITINSSSSDNEELAIEATEDMCDERYLYKKVVKQNTDSIDTMCINSDYTKIAVGGKEGLLKVYDFNEETCFTLWRDVRHRRNYKMSMFNTISLSWNKVDDSLLASIVPNGTIAVFDLNNNYTDRLFASTATSTATKICFNDFDKNILLSGYTDSNCCLIDLRTEGFAAIYNGSYSPVRDVKFDTSPDLSHNFFAVDDCGMISIWDSRKTNKPLKTIPGHQGTINNIAIHPFNKNVFATAGIDRYIRLWENKNVVKCLGKIETMFPVYRIAFNPSENNMWKIASSYNTNGLGIVHIWDFEKPSLPLLSLNEHTNTISDIVWPSIKKKTLFTAGKDRLIVRHNLNDGKHILKHVNLNGLAISPYDDIAVSISHYKEQLSLPSKKDRKISGNGKTLDIFKDTIPTIRDKKGSVYIKNVFDKFIPNISTSLLVEYAQRYKMYHDSKYTACQYNYKLCTELGDRETADLWKKISLFLKFVKNEPHLLAEKNNSSKTLTLSVDNDSYYPTSDDLFSESESDTGTLKIIPEEDEEKKKDKIEKKDKIKVENEEDEDEEYNNYIYFKYGIDLDIELLKLYKQDIKTNEQVMAQENPFYELNDTELIEAYKKEKEKSKVWDITTIKNEMMDPYDPSLLENDENRDCININKILKERVFQELVIDKVPDDDDGEFIDERIKELKIQNVLECINSRIDFCHDIELDASCIVKEIVIKQAEMGKLQFVCTVILIMGDVAEVIFTRKQIEKWFLSYIELLRRYQLYGVSAYCINKCPIDSVRALSLQSTSYKLACNDCNGSSVENRKCDNCQVYLDYICRVCERYVQGLFISCPDCFHGGHLFHMKDWYSKFTQCPDMTCHHECGRKMKLIIKDY
ncbi:WD40 repeat and WD40/YVTN repeat-like-containing domain and WD40-repeat-containing domain-containing protein [Strongyloides ratti]|uniref:GATOR2 complex protein WDR24 n=1 Tax=Strongyloides ratti TaxID=34506 RepID=A0A090LEN5_STRRB|nr:WD40 repeat and WD40/YVTN repeat-like-containing domain and WD40-repeat-containing domain-containing protein [Strongyloides ratti]CEF68216.1 WD40 repeat and WD40/YVTN repeat-like-containing domain and WD40-repeat-containing domain-containing protein [Strongyloides ratti]